MLEIKCKVNGVDETYQAYGMERLLDILRTKHTGTKEGCGEGECGACSVMMDGQLVNSCLIPAAQADGTSIQTIEGVADGEMINEIQRAFLECGGAQCGICTPGMILAATELLKKYDNPTHDQIREGLAGNLCRCTGFTKIFESVVLACEKANLKKSKTHYQGMGL